MRTFLFRAFVILLFVVANVGAWFGLYLISPVPGDQEVRVVIPKGASVRQIKEILVDRGVIRNDSRFLILARLVKEGKRLRAGEFEVPLGLTPRQVLQFLDSAKPVQYRITVLEGWTMAQIAKVFGEEHWVDPEKFLQLCRDREFMQPFGITADSLEGYLFPETYTLVRGEVDEKSLLTTMVHRFFTVWQGLPKPDELPLSRHQLVTLASIVEKESSDSAERAVIAGVFYNRLRKNMRLQSDPTTIYGLENFNGNLTRADLQQETPYNTYVISGLPPGPICNPGRAALEAVLQPAEVPFLYFVSKNDGTHQFSRNLQEHNQAVYRYQKRKRK